MRARLGTPGAGLCGCFSYPQQRVPVIGKTIARYEFTNLLGKGGMGLVYPANIAAACGIGHHDDQDSLIMELAADETPAERLGRGQPAEEQP